MFAPRDLNLSEQEKSLEVISNFLPMSTTSAKGFKESEILVKQEVALEELLPKSPESRELKSGSKQSQSKEDAIIEDSEMFDSLSKKYKREKESEEAASEGGVEGFKSLESGSPEQQDYIESSPAPAVVSQNSINPSPPSHQLLP